MKESSFLPFARPDITEAEVNAVAECVRGGWLTTGTNAARFEQEFATHLGDPSLFTVSINSATAGLHLALEAAGIGPGDEVLVPTWTFTATAEVVRYLDAHPVFVDSKQGSLNMDLDQAETLITSRTKAIIPVHFAGLAMSPSALQEFSRKYGLAVIEDAAHALPSATEGVVVGAGQSTATVFSFYATKTITTGEGGMLVTRDPTVAQRARTMRLHGINRDVFDRYSSRTANWYYEVVDAGYKYNLPDPAAALGRIQLERAHSMRDRRERIAQHYLQEFSNLPIDLPQAAEEGATHAWHLFVVRIRDSAGTDRDTVIESLRAKGIGTSVHFIPLHRQPFWRDTYGLENQTYPVAESEFARCISLPIFSSMTDSEVDRVVHGLRTVL